MSEDRKVEWERVEQRLMNDAVTALREAKAAIDEIFASFGVPGTGSGAQAAEAMDRAWRGLNDTQPQRRAHEDRALAALDDLYDPHESLERVKEAIDQAGDDWGWHMILCRAFGTVAANAGRR